MEGNPAIELEMHEWGGADALAVLLSVLPLVAAAACCHQRPPHIVLLESAQGIQQQRRLEDCQSQCGSQHSLRRWVEVAGLQGRHSGKQGGEAGEGQLGRTLSEAQRR